MNRRLGKLKWTAMFNLKTTIESFYCAHMQFECLELTILLHKWAEKRNDLLMVEFANEMIKKLLKEIHNGKI